MQKGSRRVGSGASTSSPDTGGLPGNARVRTKTNSMVEPLRLYLNVFSQSEDTNYMWSAHSSVRETAPRVRGGGHVAANSVAVAALGSLQNLIFALA